MVKGVQKFPKLILNLIQNSNQPKSIFKLAQVFLPIKTNFDPFKNTHQSRNDFHSGTII